MPLLLKQTLNQGAVYMKKIKNILLVKETRAKETRVALIPKDAEQLIARGYQIFVEHGAGIQAGFSDADYEQVGAKIRNSPTTNTLPPYQQLFADIDLVLRAKRATRAREIIETNAMLPGTVVMGALDPFEKESMHMMEYKQRQLIAVSIDQLSVPADDPRNLLAKMSKIAGRLALQSAVEKYYDKQKFSATKAHVDNIVIIGFGIAGKAAFHAALQLTPAANDIIVFATNDADIESVRAMGARGMLLNKSTPIEKLQEQIRKQILDADIVITSARKANEKAPLLIPQTTLAMMRSGAVIVDLALSEGGNVEGSEHDADLVLGNGVTVINSSGYPKALPREASELWSEVSLHCILGLA